MWMLGWLIVPMFLAILVAELQSGDDEELLREKFSPLAVTAILLQLVPVITEIVVIAWNWRLIFVHEPRYGIKPALPQVTDCQLPLLAIALPQLRRFDSYEHAALHLANAKVMSKKWRRRRFWVGCLLFLLIPTTMHLAVSMIAEQLPSGLDTALEGLSSLVAAGAAIWIAVWTFRSIIGRLREDLASILEALQGARPAPPSETTPP